MYSIVLSVSWLNLFSFSFLVCCWTPLLNFSVWLLYSSAVWFMFGTFLYFLSLLKFSLCALLSWHQLASLSPLFWKHYWVSWTSLMVQTVKRLPTMQETWVQSLGWEDLLEKEMATHSSILAWKILWMEEPRRQQSMGLQRVGHDWVTSLLGKSLISISLRLVSGSLSCSFVSNIVLFFFIFLDSWCWFLYIKVTSPSLDRVVSRRWTHQSAWPRFLVVSQTFVFVFSSSVCLSMCPDLSVSPKKGSRSYLDAHWLEAVPSSSTSAECVCIYIYLCS